MGYPFKKTWMRFPGIRSVEQTEQKFRRIRVCFEKRDKVTVMIGFFY